MEAFWKRARENTASANVGKAQPTEGFIVSACQAAVCAAAQAVMPCDPLTVVPSGSASTGNFS